MPISSANISGGVTTDLSSIDFGTSNLGGPADAGPVGGVGLGGTANVHCVIHWTEIK